MLEEKGFVGASRQCEAAAAAVRPRQHQARLGQLWTVGIVADELGKKRGRCSIVARVTVEVPRQLEVIFVAALRPDRQDP